MSEFSISADGEFEDGGPIPLECGYKYDNMDPGVIFDNIPTGTHSVAQIMDDPDAMAAVGKVWVHHLAYWNLETPDQRILNESGVFGKNDFGNLGYDGPAPPDKRHTYVFKGYALDVELDLEDGYSKQELEDAMKSHIIAEAKLTGTFAP